jgi:hypothetical protein
MPAAEVALRIVLREGAIVPSEVERRAIAAIKNLEDAIKTALEAEAATFQEAGYSERGAAEKAVRSIRGQVKTVCFELTNFRI